MLVQVPSQARTARLQVHVTIYDDAVHWGAEVQQPYQAWEFSSEELTRLIGQDTVKKAPENSLRLVGLPVLEQDSCDKGSVRVLVMHISSKNSHPSYTSK